LPDNPINLSLLPMAIALADLLDEKQVVLRLRSRKLPNALREIIQLLAQNRKIDDEEGFFEQVLAREQAHPSIVENGVAFPHVRTDLVGEIVVGIGRSRAGIPAGANQQRARLIFVIGVPERLVNDYLICVGTLVRLVRDDVIRTTLLEAETPRQFLDALTANL
jgi:mannitol/fructose-specific phosphotransferase system IIA component (Ntr-type)